MTGCRLRLSAAGLQPDGGFRGLTASYPACSVTAAEAPLHVYTPTMLLASSYTCLTEHRMC